jgi:N-methylhydantoinase A
LAAGSSWQVGIDIGGTFTDLFAINPADGEVRVAKVATRPGDRVASLLAALAAIGLDWTAVGDLVHGTTMITNAIVEGNFAPVALIATAGFGDTLAIGRQNRRHLYRLDLPPKLPCQVPDEQRFEVDERMSHTGEVLRPLDAAAIDTVVRHVKASGVEAVAVALLHSYANPAHEEALGTRLREIVPHVALSSRVNPEAREYERTATTVLSASMMPLAAGYLDRLDRARPQGSRLHLFHSAGGMAAPAVVRDLPLSIALSGPAAGVAAASDVAKTLGLDHVISFDMGGTTTDVCLITEGRMEVSSDRSIAERPLRQPMVAVDSIGAGGGSIAWLDHGALRAGPESAGADPGPACYGRGGTRPTVSDANLVLGYLNPKRQLGDGLTLDMGAAEAALATIAAPMGMDVEKAAHGVLTVANAAMIRALRRLTVERGIDGRRCTLLAFGGAGPMHAVSVARAFGIAQVVVPAHSSVFSALGCVGAEMSYSQQRTLRMPRDDWDGERLEAVRSAMHAALAAPILNAGHPPSSLRVEEVALLRYRGQSYAVEIVTPAFDDPAMLGRAFLARHEHLYGFATDEPWEVVAIRRRVSVPRALTYDQGQPLAKNGRLRPVATWTCRFDYGRGVSTPRYDRTALVADLPLAGPAVVEDAFSTVVVPPGATLVPDRLGNFRINVGEAAA